MLKGHAPQKHLVINRRLFSLLFRRLFFPFSLSPAIGAPSLFFPPLLLLLCAADPCAVCANLICMWCWMPRKERGGKKNKPSKELRGEHEPKTAPKSKTSIERTRKIVEAVQAESLGSTVGTSEVQSVPKCIQTGPSRSVLQHQLVCQMHKRFQSLLQ